MQQCDMIYKYVQERRKSKKVECFKSTAVWEWNHMLLWSKCDISHSN